MDLSLWTPERHVAVVWTLFVVQVEPMSGHEHPAAMVSREVGNGLSESRADARRAAPGDRSRSRFVRRTSYGYPERYFDGDAQAFRYRIKRFETWLAGDQKIGCWEYEPWTGQA